MGALPLLLLLLAAAPATPPAPTSLDQAEQAYFAGDLDPALKLLDQVDSEETKAPEPSPDRPRAFLLRAAIELKKSHRPAAEDAARKALSVDPDLSAEAYPPSVRQLLDGVRLTLPKRVIVSVTRVPDGTEVHLDGRLLPASGVLAVLPGPHRMVLHTAGRPPEPRPIQATADLTVDLGGNPPTLAARLWTDRRTGPVLLGVSAAALFGSALATYDLSVTEHARSTAINGSQRSFYDPYLTRYEVETGAGMAVAIASACLGVNRLHARPRPYVRLDVMPTRDGAVAVWSGTFGGP